MRRARHWLDCWGEPARMIWMLVLTIGLIIFVSQAQTTRSAAKKDAAAIQVARTAAIRQCERVKIIRHQVNLTAQIEYQVLSSAAHREEQLARTDVTSTRRAHVESARAFRQPIKQLTWTAQTDCVRAVDDPSYKPPKPQPFSELHGPLP